MTDLQQIAEIINSLGEKGIGAFYFYVASKVASDLICAGFMLIGGYGIFRGIRYFYNRENPTP